MIRLGRIDPALRRLPLLVALTLDHAGMESLAALSFVAAIAKDAAPETAVA